MSFGLQVRRFTRRRNSWRSWNPRRRGPISKLPTSTSPASRVRSRPQVIAQIRTKAQQIGADAVIIQDLSRPAPTSSRLNPTTGMYETTGGQLVPAFKGIAIKYK